MNLSSCCSLLKLPCKNGSFEKYNNHAELDPENIWKNKLALPWVNFQLHLSQSIEIALDVI